MKQIVGYFFCLLAAIVYASAQQPASTTLSTDASPGQRFVAVHGQHAALMGYSEQGLEAWAYPFQIFSGYRIGFQPQGTTSEADGRLLLRRILYDPDSITRVYIGPNYVVREKLFVPIDQPAAFVTYEVDSPQPIDIVVHFTPVLNLMWPGALGGQSTSWNPAVSGYVISEPTHGTSAIVTSPQILSHDQIANSTLRSDNSLAFTVRPVTTKGSATATFLIALNPPDTKDLAHRVHALSESLHELELQAENHYANLAKTSLQIHTPDEDVNQAVAWANIALDQAWVCNTQIGCGAVAGYGPSRNERRPQYDWFFAGDGLVAVNGLLAGGQYSRAREELEFIAKYQDKKTGMIWHELSQSAGYIDWSKYPYMFVHVDISFDYLAVFARYVSVTGDTTFANEHWPSLAAAYSYCQSIINPADHLPHIPADKEGSNEQERPNDDLGLSSAWIAASSGFADIANLTGHKQAADEALEANRLARTAVAANYWDSTHHFWIDGHTAAGKPIFTRRSGHGSVILQNIFSPEQDQELLDQLASAKFQTDWGMRSVATDSSIFDPYSYAMGSISALNSTNTALTFWKAHCPDIAFSLWSSILPWNTLDSLGHLHEVLAGNLYHPQLESVPEQTWSSAGLLDATVRGLFGLTVDGPQNEITFAPHLPAQWADTSVDNIRMPHATLGFALHQTLNSLDLEIQNDGQPLKLVYEPRIPFGARLTKADLNGHSVRAEVRHFPEEDQAHLEIDVPSGSSHCLLRFAGGVSIIPPAHSLQIGDVSTGLKITNLKWSNNTLYIDADFSSAIETTFQLKTPLKIAAAKGATMQAISNDSYELSVRPATSSESRSAYSSSKIEVAFANR